jgi:segregation and condensation protein A
MVGRVAIERRADWLVLATRLVVLRSRLLFPASPEEEADAAREAEQALQQLEERARMRAAGQWLARQPYLGIDVFARPHPKATHDSGYVALTEACLVVLRGHPGSEEFAPPDSCRVEIPDFWRIPDAVDRIRNLLTEHPAGGPLTGFLPPIGQAELGQDLKLRAAGRQQFLEANQSGDFEEVSLHAS